MAARPLSHRPGAQGEGAGLKNTLSSYLISKPAGSAGTAERLLLLLSPSPRLAWGQLLCCSAQPGTLHCCIATAAFTQPASCLGTAPVLFCPTWDTTLLYCYCCFHPARVLLGDSSSVVLPNMGHYTAVLLLLLSPSPRLAWGQLQCCSAQPGTLHFCIATAAFTQPASCLGTAPVLFCPTWNATLLAVLCMVQPQRPA